MDSTGSSSKKKGADQAVGSSKQPPDTEVPTGHASTTSPSDMPESRNLEEQWNSIQALMRKMGEKLVEKIEAAEAMTSLAIDDDDASLDPQDPNVVQTPLAAEAIMENLRKGVYKHVVVACGAGISTSAGIPDFRSPDKGIYAQLQREQEDRRRGGKDTAGATRNNADDGAILISPTSTTNATTVGEEQPPPPLTPAAAGKGENSGSSNGDDRAAHVLLGADDEDIERPEDLFTIDYFRKNPQPFITRAAGHLWPGPDCPYRPTPAHCFLRLLLDMKVLTRVYSQNIDELETFRDLLPRNMVRRVHGSFESVKCVQCEKQFARGTPEYERVRTAMVHEGKAVRCADPNCSPAKKCVYEEVCPVYPAGSNYMKPSIVFFGESMSNEFTESLKEDMGQCDLLIVMGTSLMVAPFASIPNKVPRSCHRLLLNNELVGCFETTEKRMKEHEGKRKKAASAAKPTPKTGPVSGPKRATPSATKQQPPSVAAAAVPIYRFRDASLLGKIDESCINIASKWGGKMAAELKSLVKEFECREQVGGGPKPHGGSSSPPKTSPPSTSIGSLGTSAAGGSGKPPAPKPKSTSTRASIVTTKSGTTPSTGSPPPTSTAAAAANKKSTHTGSSSNTRGTRTPSNTGKRTPSSRRTFGKS